MKRKIFAALITCAMLFALIPAMTVGAAEVTTYSFADLFKEGKIKILTADESTLGGNAQYAEALDFFINDYGALEMFPSAFVFEITFYGTGFEIVSCAFPESMQMWNMAVDGNEYRDLNADNGLFVWVTSTAYPDWGFEPLPEGERHLSYSTVTQYDWSTDKVMSHILDLPLGEHTITFYHTNPDKQNAWYDLIVYNSEGGGTSEPESEVTPEPEVTPDTNTNTGGSTTPQTGDGMTTMLIVLLAMSASATVFFVRKIIRG